MTLPIIAIAPGKGLNWLAALMMLGLFLASPAASQTLRVGDRVDIVIAESAAASGEFRVGDDGAISLPGFGLISAAGRDLRALEEDLRRTVGRIFVEPSVAVQLLTERVVYVTGNVATPGAYAHSEGLRAIQLIALAGGTRRDRRDDDDWSIAVTGVRAEQSVAQAMDTLSALQVRIDRLEAEIGRAAEWPDVDFDRRLPDAPADVVSRERALFEARAEQLTSRIAISQEIRRSRATELDAHDARIAEELEYLDQLEEERATLQDLRDRGLATAERVNTLIRDASRARTSLLQSEILRNQTRAALSELDQDIASATNDFVVEAQRELRDARLGVANLQVERRAQQEIVNITGSSRLILDGRGRGFVLQVLRAGAEAAEPADALTMLGIDDVLIVSRRDAETDEDGLEMLTQ